MSKLTNSSIEENEILEGLKYPSQETPDRVHKLFAARMLYFVKAFTSSEDIGFDITIDSIISLCSQPQNFANISDVNAALRNHMEKACSEVVILNKNSYLVKGNLMTEDELQEFMLQRWIKAELLYRSAKWKKITIL